LSTVAEKPSAPGWIREAIERVDRPTRIRELRAVVRCRAKLSRLRAGLKAQVHQTFGKEAVIPELDSSWQAGRACRS
jgi:hypothetical protein